MPNLALSGDANVDGLNGLVTLGIQTQQTATITVQQTIQNETSIDVELRDQTFVIDVPNLFVQIMQQMPENIDGNQRATYVLTRSPTENSFGGSSVQFTLSVKSMSNATFQVYGTTADKTVIKAYMKVTGVQSGSVQDIGIVIQQNL